MPRGRPKGALSRKTLAKLQEVGRDLSTAKKMDVIRAKHTLADLIRTSTNFMAHYQRKMVEFEADKANAGKLPPPEIVERFLAGLHMSIRAAQALAPYQDPKFTNVKVSMSPFDAPEAPKLIEGKALKINTKDPIELARLYASMVRAA